jgi:hypothetical protein
MYKTASNSISALHLNCHKLITDFFDGVTPSYTITWGVGMWNHVVIFVLCGCVQLIPLTRRLICVNSEASLGSLDAWDLPPLYVNMHITIAIPVRITETLSSITKPIYGCLHTV